MSQKDRSLHSSDEKDAEEMVEIIKERFSEIFLVTPYATKDDRKYALHNCMKEGQKYTINELQKIYSDKYHVPISRVAINSYINQLEAEGKVQFKRRGLGGKKIITLSTSTS